MTTTKTSERAAVKAKKEEVTRERSKALAAAIDDLIRSKDGGIPLDRWIAIQHPWVDKPVAVKTYMGKGAQSHYRYYKVRIDTYIVLKDHEGNVLEKSKTPGKKTYRINVDTGATVVHSFG